MKVKGKEDGNKEKECGEQNAMANRTKNPTSRKPTKSAKKT